MQMSTIARIVRYRPKLKLDMEYSAYWVKGLLERIDELMVLSHPDKCDEAFAHDTFCNLNSLRARVQQIAKALRWQV
ncbi:MAG: hypothetical protein Unbinned3891contig1000_5 [Prokaryotic dsDNA virus sp.]|nr:MAG: hypothetical protein Unbinned3891contig1000_5 [Prokaryotic dsDNA virus sp.]